MKLKRAAWQLHKYLSYFAFAQIFLWVLGGVVFASVPFNAWVKGGDYVLKTPVVTLPQGWSDLLILHGQPERGVKAVRAVASAQGPLIELSLQDGYLWLDSRGLAVGRADALAISSLASELYIGQGQLQEVRWIDQREPQLLGLVDELSGQTGFWQAKFDDARLYFSAQGEYLKVRTDYWVWYDALWRLHIMDYGEGEDFNNTLLRVFAWLTFSFVLTGLVLSFYAFRRTLGIKKS